jgi:invasion protein IalB
VFGHYRVVTLAASAERSAVAVEPNAPRTHLLPKWDLDWRPIFMAWKGAAFPLLLVLALLAGALIVPSLHHRVSPGQSVDSWSLICSGGTEHPSASCDVSTLVEGHGAQRHTLRLTYSPSSGTFEVDSTVAPLKVGIRIDANLPFVFDQCQANRCSLEHSASQALLSQMSSGSTGLIKASLWRGGTSPSELPLAGFQQLVRRLENRP